MSSVHDMAGSMSFPNDFRLLLVVIYLGLALFGLTYNRLVEWLDAYPPTRGMTSFAVVIGVAVTVGAAIVPFAGLWLPGWGWGVLLLGAFACSGWPMIIGQRARYAREAAEAEKRRKDKKSLRWPNNMKALRDVAAEETVAGLRVISRVEVNDLQNQERLARVKAHLFKAAALLVRAGAPVVIEDL